MTDNPPPVEPRDNSTRWMALTLWLALLIALGFTSYTALAALSANTLISALLPTFGDIGQLLDSSGASTSRVAIGLVSIAFGLATIGWLIFAWLKLVSLSRVIVIAFAWLEQQTRESTLFSDMLVFEKAAEADESASEPDLDDADRTLISDVVRYLAYAWVALLALTPVALIAGALF